MDYQLNHLATLSYLDQQHDELKEEYGDLPDKVELSRKKVIDMKSKVDETKSIIEGNKKFASESKITLVDLKNKEEKLAKQQFLVRNNKEFDAITKEIEHIRHEYSRISDELRTIGVKEENLNMILTKQQIDFAEAGKELKDLEKEFNEISSDQNEGVKALMVFRQKVIDKITSENIQEYTRIRNYHKDAVVLIKRTSCTGCYSQVPSQKVVEIRNNLTKIYTCEHCGRIIYTDDIQIDPMAMEL